MTACPKMVTFLPEMITFNKNIHALVAVFMV